MSRRVNGALTPSLEDLAVRTHDSAVLARWHTGLDRWGFAFVAFARLDLPEIFTDEVFDTFDALYAGTYKDIETAAREKVRELGWPSSLKSFKASEAIPPALLHWNHDAVRAWLEDSFSIISSGSEVHLFAK